MEESPKKKFQNIRFIKFEKDAIQKCETPVGSIPRWNYDILRAIFEYLPAKDLGNAAKVCRSWLEAAHKEKQTRKHPDYITRTYSSSEVQLESVWIEPSIGFHFRTVSFPNHCFKHHRTLPRNYDSMMFEVSCIILEEDHKDGTKMVSRNSSLLDIFYVLSAYLPQIPHVHISTSVMNYDIQSNEVISMKTLKQFVNKLKIARISKQNHENSVCFMLFCDCNISRENAHRVVATLKERCKKKRVTIWGGVVERIHSEQANKAFLDLRIAVVAISGFMQSWSVAVKTTWQANQVENRLAIFKDQVKLKKYSVGFVFAFNAQENYLCKENVESTIFKRLFPQVPLVGCDGNFVFGIDIDPISKADEQEKYKRKYSLSSEEVCYESWFTVFMILTYD